MNADETEIHDFLKTFPNLFVSVMEISKRLGTRKRFESDRTWARPLLRRMEMDGILESNPFGEYRLKATHEETTSFRKALTLPNAVLGDTTIISLEDIDESDTRAFQSGGDHKPAAESSTPSAQSPRNGSK